MTEEQLKALQAWVEAVIAEKIEAAFGRDAGSEWLARHNIELELKELFK